MIKAAEHFPKLSTTASRDSLGSVYESSSMKGLAQNP